MTIAEKTQMLISFVQNRYVLKVLYETMFQFQQVKDWKQNDYLTFSKGFTNQFSTDKHNLDLELSSTSKTLARPLSSIAEAKNYALINLLSGGTGKSMRSGGRKAKKQKRAMA